MKALFFAQRVSQRLTEDSRSRQEVKLRRTYLSLCVAGLCNRRINTIFRLLYGTVHQFSSLNLCTEPVHAVVARECTRGRAHAHVETRCTHVRCTSHVPISRTRVENIVHERQPTADPVAIDERRETRGHQTNSSV